MTDQEGLQGPDASGPWDAFYQRGIYLENVFGLLATRGVDIFCLPPAELARCFTALRLSVDQADLGTDAWVERIVPRVFPEGVSSPQGISVFGSLFGQP